MNATLAQLSNLIRLQTDLVRNSLSGIPDDDARNRPLHGSNSMSFITAHLVDARYFLAATLGHEAKSPLADVLDGARSIDDVGLLPDVDALRSLWLESEPHVLSAFEAVEDELLRTPSRIAFPIDDRTTLGVVTFLVHHEAYHLGQLGLLRKGMGYDPMSYDRR